MVILAVKGRSLNHECQTYDGRFFFLLAGIEELSALEELDIAHNLLVDHQCLTALSKLKKLMIVSLILIVYSNHLIPGVVARSDVRPPGMRTDAVFFCLC